MTTSNGKGTVTSRYDRKEAGTLGWPPRDPKRSTCGVAFSPTPDPTLDGARPRAVRRGITRSVSSIRLKGCGSIFIDRTSPKDTAP